MIGAARVAKAPPDGYQVLLGTSGTQALNQSIYEKPLYNAATDFTSVALIFEVPQVLITRKDFHAANLQEFIAHVRANQATLQYGSSGAGGTGHLACALLNSAIGATVTHIPYRGGGPAMQDLIAGRIDYQCALANIAKPQIEALQAKPIALLSVDRSPTLPDVATAHEQGLIDFEAAAWNGIFLPKETPTAIVEKLHGAIIATLETPAVAERLKQLGATVVEPADLVGYEDQAAIVLGDVVGPGRRLPRRRLWNEIALLLRVRRIRDVDHPQPGRKPGDIEHAVPIDLLAQLMRAEAHVVAVIGL